jgi:hypothetical protein
LLLRKKENVRERERGRERKKEREREREKQVSFLDQISEHYLVSSNDPNLVSF